jgi:hypothetical protein
VRPALPAGQAGNRPRACGDADAPLDSDDRGLLRAIVSRHGNEYRAVLTGDQAGDHDVARARTRC